MRRIHVVGKMLDLQKSDSFSVKDGMVIIYLHSQNKKYSYPLSKVELIEEDLGAVKPEDYNPPANKKNWRIGGSKNLY